VKRQVLSDVVASEFALKVQLKTKSTEIDFDMLVSKLEQDVNILKARDYSNMNGSELIDRILMTKEDLELVQIGLRPKYYTSGSYSPLNDTIEDLSVGSINSNVSTIKALREKVNLEIIVREDGTVDWDGALASGKEVAKFGTELWERLNGKSAEDGVPTIGELFGPAKAREPRETESIAQLQRSVSHSREVLLRSEQSKAALTEVIRAERREGRQSSPDIVLQLLRLDIRVKELQKLLKVQQLNLDIERICAYLEQEIEAGSADPADQRQLIAEVALLDREYAGLIADFGTQGLTAISDIGFEETNAGFIGTSEDLLQSSVENFVALIDDDELALVIEDVCDVTLVSVLVSLIHCPHMQVNDLLGRLGLQAKSTPSMDWGSLGVVVNDNIAKIRYFFFFNLMNYVIDF